MRFDMSYKRDKTSNIRFAIAVLERNSKYTVNFVNGRTILVKKVK